MRNDKHPPSSDAISRFSAIWDHIYSILHDPSSTRRPALKSFGWWFSSGRFDLEWAAKQLLDVLGSVDWIEPANLIFEELERAVTVNPKLAVTILRELVKRVRNGWDLIGAKDSIRAVLEIGLEDPDVSEEAKQTIHELGARGFFEFRDLLT